MLVENLFEQIINRDEEQTLDAGFRRINNEGDYEELFSELIKRKIHEEEMEKKKKKDKTLIV